MLPASADTADTIPPCPDNAAEGRVAHRNTALHGGFSWRQFAAAGVEAIAEKVAAHRQLDLAEALALSRVSLPLLGKIVQLRPLAGDVSIPSLPDSRRQIGQPLADWESFCRALVATRGDLSPGGLVNGWYPILDKPLDQDHGCDGNFSGAEVLRAIALARLVLPAEIQVLAPLATLGPKLAQVVLEFGASAVTP